MSIIALLNNDDTSVEMNLLEPVVFNDNWNGGSYSIGDIHTAIKEGKFYVLSNEGLLRLDEVIPVEQCGTDHDHGHVYQWKRNSFTAKLMISELKVLITISLQELLANPEIKVYYIKNIFQEYKINPEVAKYLF